MSYICINTLKKEARTISKARSKAFRNNRRKRRREKPRDQSMLLMDRFSKFSSLSINNIQQILQDDELTAFNKLIKDKFIIKGAKDVKIKGEKIEYYQLTNKGRNFLKKEGFCNYYSSSARHDIIHATNILDNFSKEEIDTYKHEKQLPLARYKDTSRVDGCLVDSFGTTVYIETATFNYTKQKLDAKIKYYDIHCNNASTELMIFDERRR